MRKVIIISLVMVLGISFLALSNSQGQDHAAAKALDLAAYQSAVVDRHDLPGIRLPWLGGYAEISQDEPCHYLIGWATATGKGANDIGMGPGHSNDPDMGAGRVRWRFWVNDQEIRLHRSGGVVYTKAVTLDGEWIETWFVTKDVWTVFPAFYFELGTHYLKVELSSTNLQGLPLEFYIELKVNP